MALRRPNSVWSVADMAQSGVLEVPGPVHAILGPTNTGKTHLAIERLLAHPTGMIGLPLRLLAREVYDRIVAEAGSDHVALVTGEERTVPRNSRYWVCTVEAMPVDRAVDCLVVDEVQLAADRERGHVFTDRLLRARGRRETLFLGSETIAPLLTRLVSGIKVETRPRLSTLSYLGPRKLSRLPRRAAVIAYRAEDVYALAELLRRQKGGAAVVMGALSPRTRNAQVALFEAGEVDYLVATDAIGMGLNLNIDHVAFASLQKFDGALTRRLTASEIGQVAGRAGRYMNPGSFGTTADTPALDEDTIAAVEGHRYRNLRRLRYRNARLDLSSVPGLLTSLEAPPTHDSLVAAAEADDVKALRELYREPDIAQAVRSPANVPLLWQVCGIPDFQQMLHESHVSLLARIFRSLLAEERIPDAFLEKQVRQLDQVAGDIDTLQTRLAHIRTWTYIAHQGAWVRDPLYWQQRAHAVEERLSEALHQRLTQRFVDRHHHATLRRLRETGDLSVTVEHDGSVLLDTAIVGYLQGFRLTRTGTTGVSAEKVLRRELTAALAAQARAMVAEDHNAFTLENGVILWNGASVARIVRGSSIGNPQVRLMADPDLVDSQSRVALSHRLATWLDRETAQRLQPLRELEALDLSAPGRGIAYRLAETMGAVLRRDLDPLLATLPDAERTRLAKAGLRFGRHFVFLPSLLKEKRAAFIAELRAAFLNEPRSTVPSGRVSVVACYDKTPPGFHRVGNRWVRIDALERLAEKLASETAPVAPSAALTSIVGFPREGFATVMKFLGYRQLPSHDGRFVAVRRGSGGRPKRPRRARPSESPFAVLEALRQNASS